MSLLSLQIQSLDIVILTIKYKEQKQNGYILLVSKWCNRRFFDLIARKAVSHSNHTGWD